jgi:hypothetical protein
VVVVAKEVETSEEYVLRSRMRTNHITIERRT